MKIFSVPVRRTAAVVVAAAIALSLASLESSAAPTYIARINFQSETSAVPAGYQRDFGQSFDATRGYGWMAQGANTPQSNVGNGRERNLNSNQLLDTFVHMQSGTPARWELSVPNGRYQVDLAVGDAGAFFDSAHRVTAEGVVAVNNFVPVSNNRHAFGSVEVNVTDGRLTLDAAGGANTKIDYVDVSLPDTAAPGKLAVTQTNGDFLGLGPRVILNTIDAENRCCVSFTVKNTSTSGSVAVTNTTFSGPDAGEFVLGPGQAPSFTLAPGAARTVSVNFLPSLPWSKYEHFATINLATNDPTTPTVSVPLAAGHGPGYEGSLELPVAAIARILGYSINIGDSDLTFPKNTLIAGEEVSSAYWKRVDTTKPVQVIPVARYTGRSTSNGQTPQGWYNKPPVTQTTRPTRTHLYSFNGGPFPSGGENQKLLPVPVGTTSFNPSGLFGLAANTTSFTDNRFNTGSQISHDYRFYPAKRPDGTQVPNTWLIAHDPTKIPGKNYDYNDEVMLFTNVQPEIPTSPTVLPHLNSFNGAFTNGVLDKNGKGTGMTAVLPNAAGNQYDASKLALVLGGNGYLDVTSSAGGVEGTTNTQKNRLYTSFDGTKKAKPKVTARIVGPFTNLNEAGERTGIFVGPDVNNYVAAVVEYKSGKPTLVFYKEESGTRIQVGTAVVIPNVSSVTSIDLFIEGDYHQAKFKAQYRLNTAAGTGTTVNMATTTAIYNRMIWFSRSAKAGLEVTSPNVTPFTSRFDWFNIYNV